MGQAQRGVRQAELHPGRALAHAPKGGPRGGDDAVGEGHQDPPGPPGGGGGRAPRVRTERN